MKATISLLVLLFATVTRAQTDSIAADPLDGLYEYTPQNDSLIVHRYMAYLNMEFNGVDENGEMIYPNTRYTDCQITRDPDDNFKIFVFSGDDCGMHCNGMYASVTQYASGVFERDSGFNPIKSFEKIGEGRYAVVTSEWYGGLMGFTTLDLSVYTLGYNRLGIEQMFNSGKGWPGSITVNYGEATHWFHIENPWWGDYDNFYLRFDPETNKIAYSYTYSKRYDENYANYIPKNVIPKDENVEAVQVTGEFILDKGEITRFKERFEEIKIQRD
jgi:hypothetical protein